MAKLKKIPSTDICEYCGHCPTEGGGGAPVRIYSEARAKWLESAAQQLFDQPGDDDWVDWMDKDKRLRKLGE